MPLTLDCVIRFLKRQSQDEVACGPAKYDWFRDFDLTGAGVYSIAAVFNQASPPSAKIGGETI